MSPWSPEPGMWAPSQVGLAPGPRTGVGVSLGTVRGQRAACPEAVGFCVSMCTEHVSRRASGRQNPGTGEDPVWSPRVPRTESIQSSIRDSQNH